MISLYRTSGEKVFDFINVILMFFVGFITLYPFYLVFIISINDPGDAAMGGIYLFPRVLSLTNYEYVLKDKDLLWAFFITVSRTIIGTLTSVFFTAAFAYGLSKKYILGRKYIMTIMLISMYFGGGLIPYYLVLKYLGLIGNFLVLIIPCLFSAYNAILMMTFFKGISPDIEESAKIDGANDLLIFIRIIIPLSTPVLATIALFNAVGHWNSWFDAMLFGGKKLQTVQGMLAQIVLTAQTKAVTDNSQFQDMQNKIAKPTGETIKLATMVITTLPIVFIYPFLQKYFVKGVMIGSLKG